MNADKSTAVMLYNLVEALEAAGARLQHVYFTQVCCALLLQLNGPKYDAMVQAECFNFCWIVVCDFIDRWSLCSKDCA